MEYFAHRSVRDIAGELQASEKSVESRLVRIEAGSRRSWWRERDMNERRDRETLLNDILAEPGMDGRREKLLARTLRGAKRRRLVRRVRAAGSALGSIVVLGFLAWRWVTMPDSGGAEKQEPGYVLIRTRPLPQTALVETRPLDFVNVVSSVPSPHVDAFGTRASDPIYTDVDDNTLLALTAPRPAILVRLGPNSAELVFVPDTAGEALAPGPTSAQ